MTEHERLAGELFVSGYNCAQSALCAFADITGLPESAAIRIASGLGGGVARMREVCGAVSAMAIVLGHVYGSLNPADHEQKMALYAHIQAASAMFKEQAGSIVCRELLGALNDGKAQPEMRTEAYYHVRPCRRFVELAAQVTDEYIAAHPAAPREDKP